LNNAARRPLQAGQTKPSGQRRLHKNAAHFASSGNACWNSVSERALAIEGPFAPPLAAAHQDTIFRGTWDNGISHLWSTPADNNNQPAYLGMYTTDIHAVLNDVNAALANPNSVTA